MKTSLNGLNLIKQFEGIKTSPYLDCGGLWTIGVGHLIGDGHSLPNEWNRVLTIDECLALLARDVARFERGIERYISVRLTQNQFDSLVCFAFNLGLGTLQRSSVRQKINRGDMAGAAKSLQKYNKVSGKAEKGLTARRNAEAALFMKAS